MHIFMYTTMLYIYYYPIYIAQYLSPIIVVYIIELLYTSV